MRQKKHLIILSCSILSGIIGVILDFIYVIEEETVVNEDGSSAYYEFLKPIWIKLVRPTQEYFFSIWPANDIVNSYGIILGFFLWAAFGAVVGGAVILVLSRLRKR